jgi:hypothetical protein
VQSIVSDACGWFVMAYLHFINKFYNRTGNILMDTALFLDLFEDLDKSTDWKKNEFILKLFFQEPGKGAQGMDKIFKDVSPNDITKNDDKITVPIEDVELRK